jgi:phage gpG-like protein
MAFKISGSIKGAKKLFKQIDSLEREMKAAPIKAVQDSTFLLHKTAVELIQDNSSGIPQVRWSNGRPRNVLASKPGQPPNTDTGRLVQSIKFDFKNKGLVGRVGTNLRYGAWLEFGTKEGLKPRPWLSTAIKMIEKDVAKIFAKAVREGVKGAVK